MAQQKTSLYTFEVIATKFWDFLVCSTPLFSSTFVEVLLLYRNSMALRLYEYRSTFPASSLLIFLS